MQAIPKPLKPLEHLEHLEHNLRYCLSQWGRWTALFAAPKGCAAQ